MELMRKQIKVECEMHLIKLNNQKTENISRINYDA